MLASASKERRLSGLASAPWAQRAMSQDTGDQAVPGSLASSQAAV
jgi:hypothetical protein